MRAGDWDWDLGVRERSSEALSTLPSRPGEAIVPDQGTETERARQHMLGFLSAQ